MRLKRLSFWMKIKIKSNAIFQRLLCKPSRAWIGMKPFRGSFSLSLSLLFSCSCMGWEHVLNLEIDMWLITIIPTAFLTPTDHNTYIYHCHNIEINKCVHIFTYGFDHNHFLPSKHHGGGPRMHYNSSSKHLYNNS